MVREDAAGDGERGRVSHLLLMMRLELGGMHDDGGRDGGGEQRGEAPAVGADRRVARLSQPHRHEQLHCRMRLGRAHVQLRVVTAAASGSMAGEVRSNLGAIHVLRSCREEGGE